MKRAYSWLKSLCPEESGQSAVVLILSLSVLLGAAALGIDLGAAYTAKYRMQNAADLAASSAALYLMPGSPAAAVNAAFEVAEANGAVREQTTVNAPYKGDSMMIEVVCEQTVRHGFARIFGNESTTVTGRAVAKKTNVWEGEALPFLNMDGHYWEPGVTLTIWDKSNNGQNPGNFERIADNTDGMDKSYWKKNSGRGGGADYFTIDYTRGIAIANGKKAYVKDFVESVYATSDHAYLFSLSQEAIESGCYDRTKNKQLIPPEDLVLLRVNLVSYQSNGKNGKILTVTVEQVYDLSGGDLPITFLRGGVASGLVE